MLDLPFPAEPEDVLSQSTRARLFALLSDMKRPAGTAELARLLGLHPNGVRIHLERLEQAGLLTRSRVRQRRGRPVDTWVIASEARPGGESPHAYRDLGRWLARALGSSRAGVRSIEAAGQQIGRELAQADSSSKASERGEQAFHITLSSLGFQPRIGERDHDRLTICLDNCPFRDAVRENQPVVCALHKGITRGLLDVLEPGARLAGFQPHDPEEAGCLIELTGVSGH